ARGKRRRCGVSTQRDQAVVVTFEVDEGRGVRERAKCGVRLVAVADRSLDVARGLGRRITLTVDAAERCRVEEKAAPPLPRLKHQGGTDQQGRGGAEVLIVAAPVRLPVLRHEEILVRKRARREPTDRVVLELRVVSAGER